jgi:hypothetical protein
MQQLNRRTINGTAWTLGKAFMKDLLEALPNQSQNDELPPY